MSSCRRGGRRKVGHENPEDNISLEAISSRARGREGTWATHTYVTTDKRSALSLPVARKGTQNWCLVFGSTGIHFGMLFILFIFVGSRVLAYVGVLLV